ncbi:NAD-dependent succinate-semialdehyde dehydrogenase [Roseateles sp. BYS180W]|uniref:NAD-dependent succinate-semialdehyde dehydrogenase n=1 Tax=Roseateles rivi TaxID=3299028 RepID=A0ABW7FYC2_9BURK
MSTPIDLQSQLRDPSLLKADALINGQWVGGGSRFAVEDPATGQVLSEVADLSAADAEAAVNAANTAWAGWRAKTAKERAAILMRWYQLLVQHADDLARILTAEQGKPLVEARGEILYGASFVEWYAEQGKRVYGETIPTTDPNKRYLVVQQPIGVCAAITPWNFPLAMITRKVAPALAAGCTVVIKPAEQTPLSALAAAELAQRAGMPSGVLNVLSASADNSIAIGKLLCDSPLVRHLSFTGSTEVGRILMTQSGSTVKKLALELGGNAPFIVFDDADIESAVEGAMVSKYRNAGQTCVCANRFYVQEGVYEAFVTRLAEKAAALQVGHGFEPGVQQGPLIDGQALEKVERHVADAKALGARVLQGGERLGERFFQPTVLADVTPAMLCSREETFGPVAPVFRFQTEEQVIALANATEFGLASYVYTRDISRVFRVSEALEYGMVGVNTGLLATAEVPFGGVKQSGLGREGGRQGMDEYLEAKYICLGDVLR